MFEPVLAVLPSLRENAATVVNDGRTGSAILYTKRPDPQTPRPFGLIQLTGEPDAPLPGETEASLQLTWWGPDWKLEELAEATDWLDGLRIASFGSARGLRYARNSRVVVADSELSGVFQLSDLYTCRYFSISRAPLEVSMS